MARLAHWLPPMVALGSLGVLGASCGGGAQGSADPIERLYVAQCSSCHGNRLQGLGDRPALTPERLEALGRPGVRDIVVDGRGDMPGFGDDLSRPDIDRLVAWLFERTAPTTTTTAP